jgi:hypothetical protein
MEYQQGRAAVGAGTTAGDAWAELEAPESRAAEAEVDSALESLRTIGAAPTAIPDMPAGSETPASGRSTIRAERPRGDLIHNQAGIASRLDRAERSGEGEP